ncbi:MAG: matrixin family metalloprotease [Pseudomonadota bacterium]
MPKRCLGVAISTLLLVATLLPGATFAQEFFSWEGGETTLYTGDLDQPWRGAYTEAIERWNDTPLNFTVVTDSRGTTQACDLDDRNGAWFADEDCDGPWDGLTLAITYFAFFTFNNELVEADVLFNDNLPWSIYDGNERFNTVDFRRVAVHELGHVFGADHLNDRDAIMFALIGDVFVPAIEDIDALAEESDYGLDPDFNLSITVEGDGRVEVDTRVPGTYTASNNLDCSSDCRRSLQEGLRLDLFAQPAAGANFLRWEGISGCSNLPGCELAPLNRNRSITAVFSQSSSAGDAPDVPEAVDATDRTLRNKVRITWDATAGATRYDVRRKPQGGSYSEIGSTASTQLVDRDVENMRQYLYQVRACSAQACSGWSTRDGGKANFDKPTNVRSTQGNLVNRVTTAWRAVNQAEFYQVRRSERRSGGYSLVATPSDRRLVDRDVVPGQRYFYRVRACNEFGCGGLTSPVSGFARE